MSCAMRCFREQIMRIGAYTCVFMEHAKRGDLLEYILSRGSLPENETRSIFHGVLLAVQYLHSHNIAHRDLKCENILLDDRGQAKLSDFKFTRFVIDEVQPRLTSLPLSFTRYISCYYLVSAFIATSVSQQLTAADHVFTSTSSRLLLNNVGLLMFTSHQTHCRSYRGRVLQIK